MTVGDFIRLKRQSLKLSARALSVKSGLSESYISKLEAHTIECSFKSFCKIAQALNFNSQEINLIIKSEANA